MDRKRLFEIGKWIIMGLLMASNFVFYLINDTELNLVMSVLVLLYSSYEFFQVLRRLKLNFGIMLYLYTFYLFALLSLFLGTRSFILGNLQFALVSLLLIGGDTALILYTIHKMSHLNSN